MKTLFGDKKLFGAKKLFEVVPPAFYEDIVFDNEEDEE